MFAPLQPLHVSPIPSRLFYIEKSMAFGSGNYKMAWRAICLSLFVMEQPLEWKWRVSI